MNMVKSDDKQKKQDLGIFYTPPEVADFVFDILTIWKERDDMETARWQSHAPKAHFPSVIDPAVGEGVFLKTALEKNFTKPNYIFGVDIDESVKEKWVDINLLKSFGSRAELDVHFFHQNGLLPLDETKILRYKTGGLKEFDAVVGNPPYGGVGVDFNERASPETMSLLEALARYEIFGCKKAKQKNGVEPQSTGGLFAVQETPARYSLSIREVTKMAEGIPIEILFLERFLQLAKPGGWVAIVIPDGILANSNAHYVREFITEKAKVEAIVSLPRGTFKQAGTSAKTSILFLRKLKENEKLSLDYRFFLASIEVARKDAFQKVVELYEEFYTSPNGTFANVPRTKVGSASPAPRAPLPTGQGPNEPQGGAGRGALRAALPV
ncbi:MAG: SAM-dependent DNA methyltransferase [Elusimicrobia bacterium]|nr:SAM-dependent DNA methyltransferase [Elusimicrobiota bacterium]